MVDIKKMLRNRLWEPDSMVPFMQNRAIVVMRDARTTQPAFHIIIYGYSAAELMVVPPPPPIESLVERFPDYVASVFDVHDAPRSYPLREVKKATWFSQ